MISLVPLVHQFSCSAQTHGDRIDLDQTKVASTIVHVCCLQKIICSNDARLDSALIERDILWDRPLQTPP